MNQSRTPRRIEKRATSGHGHMDSCGCRSGWEKSGTPVVALAVRTMLRSIRGQRKAAKEAHYAKGNDADAER